MPKIQMSETESLLSLRNAQRDCTQQWDISP